MNPTNLTHAERIIFARAAEKVDRVVGAERIAGRLRAIENRDFRIRRIHPDNAPCKFVGLSQVDVNNDCLRCGARESEDCRDI